jgi:hypothetical protein
MSYGTVVFAEWKASPEAATTYRLEIKKQDYTVAARRIDATGRYHDLNYQSLNVKEPFKTPMLKADLKLEWMIRSDADVSVLEDIFNSETGLYRMVLKVNDAVEWTGNVDIDQISYTRGPYPFSANVVARDLDDLDGVDYGFLTGRRRIIKVIADILAELDYGLDIRTYTRWKEGTMTADDDFLNELYIDRHALRIYGRGGEPDESISKKEALMMLLRSFGLFLIQAENHWNLFQLTSLENADNIRQWTYGPDGGLIVDSVDAPTNFSVEVLEES